VAVLSTVAVLFAPLPYHFLHLMHIDETDLLQRNYKFQDSSK